MSETTPAVCSVCKTAIGERDWGGFCPECGFSLPDREDSMVEAEVGRILGQVKSVPGSSWWALIRSTAILMPLFLLMTFMLLRSPGMPTFIPGTPVNIPNIIWLATGLPLFGILIVASSGFELPE